MLAKAENGQKPKALLGTDEAIIDDKGRILVGKKKRDRLGTDFTMCIGDNGCLYAYPAETWEAIVEDVLSKDPTSLGRQMYTRLVLGNAEDELNFDQQGRVVVPRKMREAAKLKEKVLLVGCGDRLEIWAKEEYEVYEKYPQTYGEERLDLIRKAKADMKAE